MKFSRYVIIGSLALMACGSGDQQPAATQEAKAPAACVDNDSTFKYEVESFADIRILRYRIPCWDRLTLKQQEENGDVYF